MNYMKQVAKMLGVELNQEFKLKGFENIYKFTDRELIDVLNTYSVDFVLYNLLNGQFEIKKSILDKEEKEYLENVIRPFKGSMAFIRKKHERNREWIRIYLDYDYFSLPYFEEGTMYKGMKVDKDYTLKELGLFKDE